MPERLCIECGHAASHRVQRGQCVICGCDAPTYADEHECVFVEEQEPGGRLILPPCLTCGLTAMDALEQLNAER